MATVPLKHFMTLKPLAGGSGGASAPPGEPYDGRLFIPHRYASWPSVAIINAIVINGIMDTTHTTIGTGAG